MSEPLSYNQLEQIVNELNAEKLRLEEAKQHDELLFKAKEHLYNQIINHSNQAVIVIQGDAIKFINSTAISMLDGSKEELEAIKFSEILHPNHRGEIIQYISKIVSAELENTEAECDLQTLLGKVIPVKITLKKINLSNNQATVHVQIENIQQIKSKEKEVKNLRKAIDFIDQYTEEGLLVLSKPDGDDLTLFAWNIEESNTAGCRLLANANENVNGQTIGNFLEPSIDIKIPEKFDSEFNDDYEIYIKNQKKYFKFSIYPISKLLIACKIVDITDLYITKEQLNKNLQRNELFTEILTILNSENSYNQKYKEVLERIAYHFGTKRILVFFNSVNKKTGNLTYQHAIKDVALLPADFNIPFAQILSWNSILVERKMILGYTPKYMPDDVRVFLSDLKINNAYIFPILVEEELFGSVLFENKSIYSWDTTEINYFKMISELISNLTSRVNFENKLLKAKEKAEEADRLKSSFLANMSHDIRIPMTSIIGFSDLLADPDLTIGEREEFIELISNSGQDLLTLVDNIVDVAKIETGQMKIKKDKYSLPILLKEVYSQNVKNNKLVNQDDLELILNFSDEYKSLPFDTDVFRFKQVVNNLIDNAIKFTDKGSIHFGISNVWPSTIEFYVQDTGIGIPEDTQHIIFERFSKIDRSYTKEYNGTGLGLAICKSLVELMGGEIRCVSYPGKGSTFYFTHPLPAEADALFEKDTQANKVVGAYNWESKTILIAEDVEQNFKFLEYIIFNTKAKVVWAKNGKEALDYVKEGNACNLILMDIRMPIMSGIEATREILKITKVPIIAQTAYTLGDEKDLALSAGCIDYISKPVHSDVLLKIVSHYINHVK